jgi:hypothetical protein
MIITFAQVLAAGRLRTPARHPIPPYASASRARIAFAVARIVGSAATAG